MSIEVDEELEPDGAVLGAAVVPPADEEDDEPGAVVAPEPAGALDLDVLDAPAGPLLSARSQAAISEAPNARETATAMVESLMRPPWLGYKYWGARIGPRLLNLNQAQYFIAGRVSLLLGPEASCDTGDVLSVFGDGGVVGRRSQPAAAASEIARASVKTFMRGLRGWVTRGLLQSMYHAALRC
jgi:hypothetical protein